MGEVAGTNEDLGRRRIGRQHPTFGRIGRRSSTAYLFEGWVDADEDTRDAHDQWVSFDRIHGKPSPVAPLVVLDGPL